jgi:hypothetical protein
MVKRYVVRISVMTFSPLSEIMPVSTRQALDPLNGHYWTYELIPLCG